MILLQIFLFNYVHLGVGLNAYVYIMLLLFLPIETEKVWLLLIGFTYGFIFDVFNNSMAVNAAAMTMVGFARPYVVRLLKSAGEYEKGAIPSIYTMGFRWFSIYSLILIFLHQLVVFSLDIFSVQKIFVVLFKSVINTIYTAIYVIILNVLIFRNRT